MAPELTNEAWAQIRHDYEHTERPLGDICAEHGISTGTLRDRVRRWNWTRRRLPIPFEGPPPAPRVDVPPFPAAQAFDIAAPPAALPPSETPLPAASPYIAMDGDEAGTPPPSPASGEGLEEGGKPADGAIVPRLQGAVARVLPAIEATVARLAAGPAHPREIERAGRALAALTRTLRELNGLLERHRANVCSNCGATPRSLEELRRSLARKLEALIAGEYDENGEAMAEAGGGAEVQEG